MRKSLYTAPSADGQSPRVENAAPLWTISDIATYLCVSRRGVERLIASGALPRPCARIGRLPRWKPIDIIEWVEKGGGK
ncbi:MAG: helix-turn-helix transcriptional regulator [Isosphaeraceae bacterium]